MEPIGRQPETLNPNPKPRSRFHGLGVLELEVPDVAAPEKGEANAWLRAGKMIFAQKVGLCVL